MRELALAMTLLVAFPLAVASAQDIPTPPATFFGRIMVDGHSVSDGTAVVALINGKLCGEAQREPGGLKGTWTASEANPSYGIEVGDSLYVVDVVSDSQIAGCGSEGAIVTFLVAGEPAHQQGLWTAGPNPLDLTAGTLPQPAATPSEAATSSAQAQQASDDGGFNWWPALAGGLGFFGVASVAALWQWRRTARRTRP